MQGENFAQKSPGKGVFLQRQRKVEGLARFWASPSRTPGWAFSFAIFK